VPDFLALSNHLEPLDTMQRITKAALETRVHLLNLKLGEPRTPYVVDDEFRHAMTQPGSYYVGQAYGGFRLEQMCDSGGSRDISKRGTRREVYEFIGAMLAGIEALEAKRG